jgi:hypothetical protein
VASVDSSGLSSLVKQFVQELGSSFLILSVWDVQPLTPLIALAAPPLGPKLSSSKSLSFGLCAKTGEETEMEDEESECELSFAWIRVSCPDLGEVEAVVVVVIVARAGIGTGTTTVAEQS